MDNKELLETNELYSVEVDFAVGKNLTELKKSINEKIELGYRPIEQNPFFDKEGNLCSMVVYEEYEQEEQAYKSCEKSRRAEQKQL